MICLWLVKGYLLICCCPTAVSQIRFIPLKSSENINIKTDQWYNLRFAFDFIGSKVIIEII